MWKSKLTGLAVAGLLIAGVAGGCSAGSSSKSASSNAGAPPAVGAADGARAPQAGAAVPGAAPAKAQAEATLAPGDVQRSIIYTGSIIVRVKDVDVAAAQASSLATGAGGYLGGDNRDIDASRSIATLTLRVPAGKFDSTVTALGALGTEQSRNVSTEDVTEKVIDVQSRLRTQQASVNRIRALIANTNSISQIVSLEDELTQRESDLESMEAQLRSLTDLATLSTITVTLLGPQARVITKPTHKKTGFVGGLESGWNGFVKSLTVLLTILGAVLPFAVAIGIPVLIIVWYLRRRRPTPVIAQPVMAQPVVATGPTPGGLQPPA